MKKFHILGVLVIGVAIGVILVSLKTQAPMLILMRQWKVQIKNFMWLEN